MTDTIIYRDDDGDVIYAACVGCEFYKACVECAGPLEDEAPCQAHPRKRRKRRER